MTNEYAQTVVVKLPTEIVSQGLLKIQGFYFRYGECYFRYDLNILKDGHFTIKITVVEAEVKKVSFQIKIGQ